jgi:hypothetical protein
MEKHTLQTFPIDDNAAAADDNRVDDDRRSFTF